MLGLPNYFGLRRTALMLAIACLLGFLFNSPAGASHVPGTTVNSGGLTLTVTPTSGLDPQGSTVTVSGSGYNPEVGIYVSLCVSRPAGVAPSPCGGGNGTSRSGAWISPLPDAELALQPDGSFSVDITINPTISPTIDCRNVGCSVVTRADHRRIDDRSFDVQVPVTFTGVAPSTTAAQSATAAPSTTVVSKTVTGEASQQSTPADQSTSTTIVQNGAIEIAMGDPLLDLMQIANSAAEAEDQSTNKSWIVTATVAGVLLMLAGGSIAVRARRKRA